MYLRRISIRDFKTIRRLDIDFAEGINVIFGLNETGKSTFLEALSAAFFTNADSGSSEVLKYRPWQSDADPYVYVVFSANANECHLEKTFIGTRRGRLRCPVTHLDTSNKDRIKEEISKLLPLGVATAEAHKRTFWIAQRELEDTIDKLQGDGDIRSALKSALMKADGDIETIKADIREHRGAIAVGSERPAKYPGPLKLARTDVERLEAEVRDLRAKLSSLDSDMERHKLLTAQVANIEREIGEDENVLAAIEKYSLAKTRKESADKALDAIQEEIEANQTNQFRLVHLRSQTVVLEERQQKLDDLLSKAKLADEVNELRSRLQQEEALLRSISSLDAKINPLLQKQTVERQIAKADVDSIRALEKSMATKQAALKAAQLSIEAKGLSDVTFKIAEDGTSEHVQALRKDETQEFRANERVSLTLPNQLQLAITSGVSSAVSIQKELHEAERSFNALLSQHGAASATMLSEKYEEQQRLQAELSALQNEKRGTLRGRSDNEVQDLAGSLKKEVEEKGAQVQDTSEGVSSETFQAEKNQLIAELAAARAEATLLDATAKRFVERYGGLEAAQQMKRERAREAVKAESALEETPRMDLSDDQVFLRKNRLEAKKRSLEEKRTDLLKLSGALQVVTVSSDVVHLKEAEMEQAKAVEQANLLEFEAYQILEKVLEEAEIEVSQHLVEPIKTIVSVTLPRLTAGRYSEVNLDDSLEVQSVRHNTLNIDPVDLSTGARGQLALALRLALVDHLSRKERQMIVLDDALVNFDGDRLTEAKNLLSEIAKQLQVLYLTCHSAMTDWPEAAKHTLPTNTNAEYRDQYALFSTDQPPGTQ